MRVFTVIFFVLLFGSVRSQTVTATCLTNYLCNGGFDNTTIVTSVGQVTAIPCWSTMASDGKMEVWANNFNGVPSYNGIQFVELNANEPATMFQDFTAGSGLGLTVGFAHRGRAGSDTVQVSIGPVGGPYTVLGRFGDGDTSWGYHTGSYLTPGTGSYRVLFTPVYWSGGNIALGNFLDSVSVTIPSLGTATITATPTLVCFGGSSTLTALGVGSSTWISGASVSTNNTFVITPASTITYSWSGYTNNNCFAQSAVTVSVISTPTVNVAVSSSAACSSANITFTASGASTYTWQPPNVSGSVISVAPSGMVVYTVTGTSTTGCQSSKTFTQTVFPVPVMPLSSNSQTVCRNSVYTVTASGASTYTWQPLNQNGATYTAVANGPAVITVTGTSASGCTATASSSVSLLPWPLLTIKPFSITCASLGSATAAAAGGTGPYSYTWTPSGQTGTLATSLVPGNYTLSVYDPGTGCITDSTTYFAPLVPMTGTLAFTPSLTCNGVDTAKAGYTTIAGGSPNQNYLWTNGSTSLSVPSPTTLGAGSWSVTVTDALTGCAINDIFTVTQPPALSLTAIGATVCTTQSFSLTANSPSGNLTYKWSGPQAFSSTLQNPYLFNVGLLATGPYTVTGTDPTNCKVSAVALVKVVSTPSPALALSNSTLCAQNLNNSPNTITLSASGANTYTLLTSGSFVNSSPAGPVFQLLSNTAANNGLQTATLQASNGVCTVSSDTSFLVIPNPVITVSQPNPVICFGESYTFTAMGASSFTWSPLGFGLAISAQGKVAVAKPAVTTVYSIYGDSLGCNSASQVNNLTVNPLPTLTLSPADATICLNNSTVLSTAGTGTAFSWIPATGLNSTTGATVSANPQSDQTYTVIASLNSCTNIATASVKVLPLPIPAASISQPTVCFDAPFTLLGLGGQTYQWSGPGGQLYGQQNVDLTANNLSMAGIYTLTVTDKNGCSASTTAGPLAINLIPFVTLPLYVSKGCLPFCTSYTLAPEVSVLTSWNVDGLTIQGNYFNYCFNRAGTYPLRVNLKDPNNGCSVTETLNINVYPKPVPEFDYFPKNPVEGADHVEFVDNSKGRELNSWHWYFIANGDYQSKQQNTNFMFSNQGTYPVALVVTNIWGCSDTVVKNVQVRPNYAIYVPNAFTPNDDGLNDSFGAVANGLSQYHLYVYDRWGDQIFTSSTIKQGWDGTYKGQACPIDVYAWKIKATFSDGATKDLSGSVTLYR